MAIVPNLNGVQISNAVPLVDPHNPAKEEREYNNDVVVEDASVATTIAGNQLVLAADPLRKAVTIINSGPQNVSANIAPLGAVTEGVPLEAGNGFTWKGQIATKAFYVYGVAGQSLVIWKG